MTLDAYQENFSLQLLNSFGFAVRARQFASVATETELTALLEQRDPALPLMIIGGGSNLVLAQDYPGLVLHMDIRGRELLTETDSEALVRVGAGENWHDFVRWCLDRGLFGLENLALIPGSVGAAPIQNIGAYGVEISEYFHALEAMRVEDAVPVRFDAKACEFGYRHSIFKAAAKDCFIITRVSFRLSKLPRPRCDYAALKQELVAQALVTPTPEQVFAAVCAIRQRKLPDPRVIGNAGSFFKNPLVTKRSFEQLQQRYPRLVSYPAEAGSVKLAAGWLIEQCGWRGYRQGDAGVYEQQALVLVNYGAATGAEILALAARIQASVQERFGIELELEPRVYP